MSIDPESRSVPRCLTLLVTGLSGAGHSTALKVLEDSGFEAIDNIPLSLVEPLLKEHPPETPLVIGVDMRSHKFDPQDLQILMHRLQSHPDWHVQLVYLDCQEDVLLRRFSESRRRHPLKGVLLHDAVTQERQLMAPIRSFADYIFDTSTSSAISFARLLRQHFEGMVTHHTLQLHVMSFSYRYGIPLEADIVLDARFLPNPYYDPALRSLTGRDWEVAENLIRQPLWKEAEAQLKLYLLTTLKGFKGVGRSYLTIACGCTGGQHRSVFMAEMVAEWLKDQGEIASIAHRDVKR